MKQEIGPVKEFYVNAPLQGTNPPKVCVVCGAPGKEKVQFDFWLIDPHLVWEQPLMAWVGLFIFFFSLLLVFTSGLQAYAGVIIGLALISINLSTNRHVDLKIAWYICDPELHPYSAYTDNWIGQVKRTLFKLPNKHEATFTFSSREFALAFLETNRITVSNTKATVSDPAPA